MSLPTISRINPTSGPTTGGITAIISGTNLAGATTVTFGTVTAVPTSSTATTVSVVVPANTAGTVRVSVTTPNGTSTSIVNFTYAPIRTGFSLAYGDFLFDLPPLL
ncbi:1,4-alpha-glucan-branching enzyme [Penicillium roqueforti FM164]|uniref:1,4-alpha-glucan-branching enzyme n=1 Tax=Penicillium roqueforti (strain FM164) TaxID=1365484 RepID=W6R8J4_PENRF|nr:1,4-alpha-glucan-branching enzyme [Penicillium roqueforti FM164]